MTRFLSRYWLVLLIVVVAGLQLVFDPFGLVSAFAYVPDVQLEAGP